MSKIFLSLHHIYLYEEQHKWYFIITFPNFQKEKKYMCLYIRGMRVKCPGVLISQGEHHRHRDSSLRRQAITHGSPEDGGTWGAPGSGRRQEQQQKAFIRVSHLPI